MIFYYLFISPIELIVDCVFTFFTHKLAFLGIIGAICGVSLVINFLALPIYNFADALQEKERKIAKKMEPYIKRIKTTFKGDERFMMLQAYYSECKYNPIYTFRSSLSILIEIPFFIAAYHYLSNAEALKGASFWIFSNLGAPDALFHIGKFPVNVLPIMMTAINLISGAIYSKNTTLRENIQIYVLAAIFLVLLYNSPSGLVIYWILNNLFSLVKNIVKKHIQTRNQSKEVSKNNRVSLALKSIPKSVVISAAILSFTIFVYGPLEIYLNNSADFPMNFNLVFPFLYILFFAFAFFLCFASLVIPEKKRSVFAAFLFACVFAMFVQNYILPNNFGELDGTAIDWAEHSKVIALSMVAWIIVFILFIFINIKKPVIAKKVFTFLSVIVVLTQAATMVFSVKKYHDFNINSAIKNNRLTKDDEWTISENRNCIVFLLDRFSSTLFEEIMQDKSNNIKERFADFTFYPDCVSPSNYTIYSVPAILSGSINKDSFSFADYVNSAVYEKSPLGKLINSGECNSAIFTESLLVDRTGKTHFGNLKDMVHGGGYSLNHFSLSSKSDYAKLLAKISLFKYSSSILKKFFLVSTSDFSEIASKSSDTVNEYFENDTLFYDELCKTNLEKKYDKGVFRFFHLNGAHMPYTMNENCERVAESDEYRQALGSLKIVETYLNKLKKNDSYDDSVVMIISDHGNQKDLNGANPIFLIKNANEKKKFSISQSSITLFDFSSMVVDAFKDGTADIENKYTYDNKDRYFYALCEKDTLYEYKLNGTVRNAANLSETGRNFFYGIKNTSFDYKLGTKLDFTESATANPYCIYGFDRNEVYGTWINSTSSQMKFKIGKVKDDLLLTMNYSTYAISQKIILYANDVKILDTVSFSGSLGVVIPKECLDKSKTLNLRFEIPDAINFDGRYLALFMKDITISETGKNAKKITLGTKLDFTESATANPYCIYGFDRNEVYGTWINSTSSQMKFKIGKVKGDLLFTMNYGTYESPQNIILYANDEKILDIVSDSGPATAVIPKECLKDNGVLDIKFDIPTAHPIEKEGNRCLALFMKDVTISKNE